MKKLIAISITLALVVSAAFAQVTVGGSAIFAWRFLQGDNGDASELSTPLDTLSSGDAKDGIRGRVNVAYTNEASTFGGWIQLRATNDAKAVANVWWKPIDQLKFTGGYFVGGYGAIGVVNVDEEIIPVENWGRVGNYIPWAFEVLRGASAEITPIDNFYFLVSVPLNNAGDVGYNGYDSTPYIASNATAEDIFKHTMARVGYTFDGVGSARATFIGGTGRTTTTSLGADPFTVHHSADPMRIDLGFTLTMIEGLAIDFGAEIPFVASTNGKYAAETTYAIDPKTGLMKATLGSGEVMDMSNKKVQLPYEVNLRVNYTAGAFNLAGGFALLAGGKSTVGSVTTKQGVGIGLTLNPTFDVGIVKVGLVGELAAVTEGDYTDKDSFNLNIVPYVQKDVGPGSAYLGFQIRSTTVKNADDKVTWSIPVGLNLSF